MLYHVLKVLYYKEAVVADKKPVLVHRTVTYIRANLVDDEVESLVAQLVKDGYLKIRVIVHEHVPGDNKSSTEYSTTVVATLKSNIDIGTSL